MIGLQVPPLAAVAVLGMHCDDIAIGAGGTLLDLCAKNPGLRVSALVMSGAGTEREAEESEALSRFCPGAELDVRISDLPDGRGPAHWDRVKNDLALFRRHCDSVNAVQLVLAPQRDDAHQDHRMLAELVPTEFRDHLVLGYEILKWETDTVRPDVFVPLSDEVLARKVALLAECYPSQRARDWYDDEAFTGLARLRGVQSRSRYAEGFMVEKMTLVFADVDQVESREVSR